MSTTLQIIHWVCGLVIVCEALNKLYRTEPCKPGMWPRERATEALKALAWYCLALGGAGAVAAPLMPALTVQDGGSIWPLLLPRKTPSLQDVCLALGFAVLIIRTRVKEG